MSHFSFTRLSSDKCATEKRLQESEGPYKWTTDRSVKESEKSCFMPQSPYMQNSFHSVPDKFVDYESELRGQNDILSKCPEEKHKMSETPLSWKLRQCKDEELKPQYTRTKKSCNILSGVSINRFDPLTENLQKIEKIHKNTYIGRNTRIETKDTYKNARKQFSKNGDQFKLDKDKSFYVDKIGYAILKKFN